MADSVDITTELSALFKADTTLDLLIAGRVYSNMAPTAQQLPCVVMELQPNSEDNHALDGKTNFSDMLISICAYGGGNDMTALHPITKRIEILIDGKSFESSAYVSRYFKETPVEEIDTLNSTSRASKLGAMYRAKVSVKF